MRQALECTRDEVSVHRGFCCRWGEVRTRRLFVLLVVVGSRAQG